MSTLLPFIVIGLASGSVYGLAGVGLVLTYRTSGVFNFADGALATIAAYVFFSLFVSSGWSWPVAAAVSVLVLGPLMGFGMEYLARAIAGATLAWRVASTVGLLLAIEAVIELLYNPNTFRTVPQFLAPGSSITIDNTVIPWSSVITFLFAIAATVLLSLFLRMTRKGVAMRAVVDNPQLLDVHGTSPVATRRWAWVIGCTLAAASGVLFAPLLPLNAEQLTLLVVSAYGAAAIGAFRSLPLTLVGGLLIGILASLCTKWFTLGLLAGLPSSLPFVVLFIVLLVFPKRWLVSGTYAVPRVESSWRAPVPAQLLGGGALLVFLLLVPTFAGTHLTDWTIAVGTAIVFLSLGLLARTSGQVSLAQVAFTAIGASAFSHLAVGSGLPWLLALLLAGLIAVPIGAFLAIPAIRLGGLYLALATFGFAIALQQMFYSQSFMFGANNVGLVMPRPHLSFLAVDTDKGFYYLVVLFAVLATLFVIAIDRGRMGRLLRGLGDSPLALATTGASVNVTRVMVFCVAAFLAAIGGALVGVAQNASSSDAYTAIESLTYFVLIMIIPGGTPWNAVIAAAGLTLIPAYVGGETVTRVLQLLFGVNAIMIAVLPASVQQLPEGVRARIDSTFGRLRFSRREPAEVEPATASTPPPPVAPPRVSKGSLEVRDLSVHFGALVAVDGLSLKAPTGTITGLIGPNGAGKTTTFNACSGLVRTTDGEILIDGHGVARGGPANRARDGLGRTFQVGQLFDSLTVRENVALGVEGAMARANPLRHAFATRRERREIGGEVEWALELCGIAELAESPTSSLATGQRRLVELAKCLAGPFRILLLDEPSSGLDPVESRRFGEILLKVVDESQVGILLIEHDMALVMQVCQQLYVLDFGRLIWEGTPKEMTTSSVVRAAYLSDTEVTAAVGDSETAEAGA